MIAGVMAPVFGVATAANAADPDFKVLVFNETAGFVHPEIGTATTTIQNLGIANNFAVDVAATSTGVFTEENLAQYDAVIWNSTTGDVLNSTEEAAFQAYIEGGGGYAGLHSASDTEDAWTWYKETLVGADFNNHPANQTATIKVEDATNESTKHLTSDTWTRLDEWYNFTAATFKRSDMHVLLSLDEKSYAPGSGAMGADHPVAWCQDREIAGTSLRSWYTALGHTNASYSEPAFVNHILGGIKIAAGAVPSGCAASQSASYDFVTLDDNTANPMAMDIAPDGTVFYAERDGRLRQIDPATNVTTTVVTLPVTQANEDGFLGVVVDPDFENNGWIYLYYAPSDVGSDGPHNRIGRFTYDFGTQTASLSSEVSVLKITTQRNRCCHMGGDMVFDTDGNLILAVGDNTDPFESSGYSPIDERSGRQDFDAQRTSGNTNDLRGKILRIHPEPDGTYTIPDGNLFAPGTPLTRPEIYAMGFRNPFRIGLDPANNHIIVGDYGPDAGSDSATRGPRGGVEWNLLTQPGNYGWPYCQGDIGPNNNGCYMDFNFQNNTTGAAFDPNALVNDSPNNTGMTNLPPVIQPTISYPNSGNTTASIGAKAVLEIGGGGGAPMGGPVYRYDENLASDTKWPEYWDGKGLLGEWNQGTMYSVQLDRTNSTSVVDINQILPAIFDNGSSNGLFRRAMDFEWGPDGALYVVDWGSGFNGNNSDSGVYRIDYTKGRISPIARAAADVTTAATAPLEVNFSSAGSQHPFGLDLTYAWNFGDGATSTEANPTHTYTTNGQFNAQLTVTDEEGGTAVANVTIVVGNELAELEITFPENGGFFEWGDQVRYEVNVNDPDGVVDCDNVSVLAALGHDTHNHDYGQQFGCEGWIQTARDAGHGLEANLFWVVNATYNDDGGAAGIPLTAYATNMLNPKTMQAEYFDLTGQIGDSTATGVATETTTDTLGGGTNLTSIDVGDFWGYRPVNMVGMDSVDIRLASAAGGTIEARFGTGADPDPATATVIGTLNYTATGSATTYEYQTLSFSNVPTGEGTLFFVNTAGTAKVNYYQFNGEGVESNSAPTATLTVTPTEGVAPLNVTANLTDVVDPDGGEGAPVTIEWDAGDGYAVGTASQSYTFTEPDIYVIRARITDANGAFRELEQSIEVSPQEIGQCFLGRSDGFDDTMLDTDRWDSNVRTNQNLVVSDGALKIPAAIGDLYQNSTPVSPNLVLQDAPAGAWTMDTKVTIPARIGYQQAGLLVYANDDNYIKLTLQARTGDATPNAATRVVQMAKEDNGTAAETNSPNLTAAFPDTAYLRLVSDGTTLTGYYSADNETWTQMAATRTLAGLTEGPLKVGLFSSGSTSTQAQGAPIVTAEFDWFTITPDDTAVAPDPDDTFEGERLDPCKWTVLNENGNLYRVQEGNLEIDTTSADIANATANPIPNLVMQDQPDGDWVVETKLDATAFDRQYQAGGIMVYLDDANYVKLYVEQQSATARQVEFRNELNNAIGTPSPNITGMGTTTWLRVEKIGDTYTAYWSADGETWTQVVNAGTPVVFTNAAVSGAKVGLFAVGTAAQGTENRTAKFDYWEVQENGVSFDVDATLTPSVADGTNGWFKQAVTVTLATEAGDPEAQDYIEYNLGEGWLEYTTPLVLTDDGEYSVQYRASEAGGASTGEKTVTVKIDATVPTADGSLVVDPEDANDRTLEIASADATSGVASVQYSNNGGVSWATYTAPVALPLTGQTIQVRATDAAGNVSAVDTVEVPAIVECEDVAPSDQFDGTVLDVCRWTVVNEDTTKYRVQGGFLEIDTTQEDIYSAGGSIPNVVLQDQPAGDWTIETKVDTSAFDRQYQQAGLMVYVDADNYLKFDVVTTNAADSALSRNFEFRHEIAGAVQNPQNNVSATATGGIAYLRIAKVGDVFSAAYSTDGATWTDFTNTFTDAALSANAKVGVYALGSASAGTAGKTAKIDYFTVIGSEDVTDPTVTASVSGRTVTLTAEDTESGVASIEYQLSGESTWTTYTAPFEVAGTDLVTVSYRATDNAGNVSDVATVDVPATNTDVTVDRVFGANRYETAVEISEASYSGTAPVVYIASGENYPDALSAGPAAALEGGPLLLVSPSAIPAVVSAEITRLDPARIVVVGGTPSVDAAVFAQLQGMADTVDRVAGADRYETSRMLVEYAFGETGADRAYIATGKKFPDALAAGGAAGAYDAPVILVNGELADLDAATVTLLGDLGVTETRVLGGADTVSAGIFADADAVTDAVRLAGANRYDTARAINADAFDTAEHAFLVTGLNYPDALAGSAWAGAEGAPVFAATTDCVPGGVLDDLEALGVTHVTLLGGEPSLSASVFALTRC
ncbi:glucose/arabinose dehydrogenase/regulation of enolase protein 1 (concanavalin A-like superfamily)/putative cell wall-binding protein [Leifsonia sp. AK011]|uniref:ThuA domain-containing protein n=1 Tax=Leifsonia sp. AK011 TaxID=2723075 RepID=UPI0015C9C6CE|nr:ThuA domain-containing protein [Leifsonia sp. AK011]NYF11696.1 glucose/arabinose dehydrogenase/regulation of enolase protein 1 (concanavalin A-like superfamily)/putative cell wall-binding protein [Leifsonia sp. AK011]